ncbi:MAG TPA: hypothetical protein VMT54_00280 [Candidatus Cybelea sp.]|nr:hypothetical protein [Candidatus Cybelea sp.]
MTQQPKTATAAETASAENKKEGTIPEAALDEVSGGTVSNVMKTKHDTVKNSISNVR